MVVPRPKQGIVFEPNSLRFAWVFGVAITHKITHFFVGNWKMRLCKFGGTPLYYLGF